MSTPIISLYCVVICICLKHIQISVAVPFEEELPNYDGRQCLKIQHPICQGLKYNETTTPNLVSLSNQDESAKRMNDYLDLIKTNCSHYLRLFLCTIYFPMCTRVFGGPTALRPCRPLCEHVQSKCEPIMMTFHYHWPDDLKCSSLPSQTKMCIQPDSYDLDLGVLQEQWKKLTDGKGDKTHGNIDMQHFGVPNFAVGKGVTSNDGVLISKNLSCLPSEVYYQLPHTDTSVCLVKCSAHMLYKQSDKQLAEVWLLVWSILCIFSSTLTLMTFFTDRERFPYPERPIVYLSSCYFFYAAGVLLRLAVGTETAACQQLESPRVQVYVHAGQESPLCVIIFLLCEYFQSASSMWWLLLTVSWFLSASRKWGSEAVESVSSFFHLLAWSLPSVYTVTIILLHRIQADELSGLCGVLNDSSNSLLYFRILPHLICVLLGSVFLTIGFSSLWSVHRALRKDVTAQLNMRRLEKLMAKVGIFSILYCIPAFCVLMCLSYEFYHRNSWRHSLQWIHHKKPSCWDHVHGLDWSREVCHSNPVSSYDLETVLVWPHVEIQLLKIFMLLVVGITSGTWVWANMKSLHHWHNFMQKKILFRSPCCLSSGDANKKSLQENEKFAVPFLRRKSGPIGLFTTSHSNDILLPGEQPLPGSISQARYSPSDMHTNCRTHLLTPEKNVFTTSHKMMPGSGFSGDGSVSRMTTAGESSCYSGIAAPPASSATTYQPTSASEFQDILLNATPYNQWTTMHPIMNRPRKDSVDPSGVQVGKSQDSSQSPDSFI